MKKKNTYSRRRPDLTPIYKIIQEELSTFIADREMEGRPLPEYIINEFESFLKCGIPQFGFLRLKCNTCDHEIITAFSCKKRGFCPSCTAKRSAETAFHLIDNVLPHVPYRQFVITYPIPMRYWLHSNRELFSAIHTIVKDEINNFYKSKAPENFQNPQAGIISFTQRFGSALNLNLHHHILVTDGVFHHVENPQFNKVKSITDADIAKLITSISGKAMKSLKRKGLLDSDGEVVMNPKIDALFQNHESLAMATGASISGKIAFGPNAGKFVTRIGKGFGYGEEIPLAKGKLCYSINGFSIHARRHINTLDRKGLEKLIGYISRGPISNERIEIIAGRKVKLRLKTAFSDGTTHLLLSFSEFLEKISAIIPPPKNHLVRWSGCFASNSPYRRQIILNPDEKKGFEFENDEPDVYVPRNYTWAQMLDRVFGIDVLECKECGGELIPIGAIKDELEAKRYLKHMGLDHAPPCRGPPRAIQDELFSGIDTL